VLACNPATSIGDIRAKARDYNGKTVTIRGTVSNAGGLLSYSYFELNDKGGMVSVLSPKPAPNNGDTIKIVGRVYAGGFGPVQGVVVLEESGRNK
jgi:aspartyl/asparaginyl-tRNA synthetase